MENTRKSNLDFGTIAWGAIFILWGITEMFESLPEGTGAIGIGLILIGLNLARSWKGQPTSGFTTTLGILALLLGALELARPFLHLSFRAADLRDPADGAGLDPAGQCLERNTKIMNSSIQRFSLAGGHIQRAPLTRGLLWGLIGGLAGTLVMDILLMGALLAVRLPASFCFSLVGDTMARFFSLLGIEMAGGIPTGIVTHYLIGLLVGMLFGTVVAGVPALRVDTTKKCIIAAILYVEILSQPLLAMAPLLLKMDRLTVMLWYGGSLIMHLILAVDPGFDRRSRHASETTHSTPIFIEIESMVFARCI